jgi:hypothetical protein
MATSPTQRAIKVLKAEGYIPAIVERWNAFAKIRQDLYGCIDIIAIKPFEILGIQCTSDSNVSARVTKSVAIPALRIWLLAGGKFQVWGFGKKGARGERKVWKLRKVIITLEMLSDGKEKARE